MASRLGGETGLVLRQGIGKKVAASKPPASPSFARRDPALLVGGRASSAQDVGSGLRSIFIFNFHFSILFPISSLTPPLSPQTVHSLLSGYLEQVRAR